MATKLTPDEIADLRAAARARRRAEPNAPYELTDYQATLVATVARLTRTRKPATVADVLTDILDRTQIIHNVNQARNAMSKLATEGLIEGTPGDKEPGTPGKAPLTYTVTDKGHAALATKNAEIIELARLLRSVS